MTGRSEAGKIPADNEETFERRPDDGRPELALDYILERLNSEPDDNARSR